MAERKGFLRCGYGGRLLAMAVLGGLVSLGAYLYSAARNNFV